MSLYKREGSPFWQYSFAVNGIRFRGSTGCTAKREAALVEAERRHEAKNRRSHQDPWRIRDCLGAYWNERAKDKKSAVSIFAKLEALSRVLGRDTLITDITNAMLLDYRATRRGEKVRGKLLQANGVNRDFACLHAALKHANEIHQQPIPALAWSRIRVAEPSHRIRFLNQDEYAELLKHADPELRKIIKMAVATGLRKANLLDMDWSEVDLPSSRITVTVKGDSLHSVRLTGEARAALAMVEPDKRKGPVFDTTNFRRRWASAVKLAGLSDFRFHDLRHTFASWARMAGADLADICEALGHSNIAVTMRYAHIEPQHHTTAFDRISGAVWSHSASHYAEKQA